MEKVTLPLSPERMVDFFKDKEQVYTINVKESLEALQSARFMLMYIANLGLTCNLDMINNEILREYMFLKEMPDIINLRYAHANTLYLAKYGEFCYLDEGLEWLKQEAIDFVKANAQLVVTQLAFLNSTQLYILCQMKDGIYREQLTSDSKMTDEAFVELGFTILKLYTVKDFLLQFLADCPEMHNQIYFKRYFEEYMFNGKNLFAYFSNDKNAYMGLVNLMTSSMIDNDQEATNELNEMLLTMEAVTTSPEAVDESTAS